MKHFTHLTQNERYQISSLLKAKKSQSEIARIIGCNKAVISREVKRNTGQRGYRSMQTQNVTALEKHVTVYA